MPYALGQKVEEEPDRLVAEGILKPIEYSDWAAPIIAVVKSDKKSVRICGDFVTTVNAVTTKSLSNTQGRRPFCNAEEG